MSDILNIGSVETPLSLQGIVSQMLFENNSIHHYADPRGGVKIQE